MLAFDHSRSPFFIDAPPVFSFADACAVVRCLPLQCFPGEGPQLLAPALQRLLAAILSRPGESGVVTAAALGIFARVLLHNGAAFLQLCQSAAAAGVVAAPLASDDGAAAAAAGTTAAALPADPAATLLLALLDLWLERFDSIGQPASRKLGALALCVLLTLPLPAVLERLEAMVTHITAVWFEVGRRVGVQGVGRRGVCVFCKVPEAFS